ncbi:hypothetical protein [Mycoplasmopsis gallopavonis]|uniref:Exonuclease n=1 Tax=Mycoplasmopsis gallopavonis TaxID=76629 RepID=A0A449AZF2_9BACT|nr:hypothetical protein [Mycoplasmopsis gallopavonis]RIV16646.1 hypothetical protein D1113_01485 [Mycoplasmopsis gallopavonis]VEU72855.1 Uncharacterised protein [Mycoplasmopsis gallopavonis]
MNKPIKHNLFIDFEGITPNFIVKLPKFKKNNYIQIPYCFTIGKVIKHQHFIYKTVFLNLKNFDRQTFFQKELKVKLEEAIHELIGEDTPINEQTVALYGWNSNFEDKVTMQALKLHTNSYFGDTGIGLDTLLSQLDFPLKDYFAPIRNYKFKDSFKIDFINNQKTGHFKLGQ